MKVILIEDVKKIGSMGDIIQVKSGFARNYLFPKNLARPATDSNLKIIEDIKTQQRWIYVTFLSLVIRIFVMIKVRLCLNS